MKFRETTRWVGGRDLGAAAGCSVAVQGLRLRLRRTGLFLNSVLYLLFALGRPNSACDVGLPLELTSGLGRDRGESGGFGGVLVAPARRREKLGRLFIGIVGSGCTRSRIMRLGLVRVRTVDIKGTGGITG